MSPALPVDTVHLDLDDQFVSASATNYMSFTLPLQDTGIRGRWYAVCRVCSFLNFRIADRLHESLRIRTCTFSPPYLRLAPANNTATGHWQLIDHHRILSIYPITIAHGGRPVLEVNLSPSRIMN